MRPVDPPPMLDAADLPDRHWDAVVVGAGPAGCAAATRLAETGHRVLLLDRGRFPRPKTCGDGLLPDAQRALERLGLLDRVEVLGHRCETLAVWSPSGHCARVPVTCLTLPRRDLDALLMTRAVNQGAWAAQATVRSVVAHPDGVAVGVQGAREPVSARLVVVATGARHGGGPLAGRAGAPEAVALRGYVESDHPLDELVVTYDRAVLPGYGWAFPLGDGRFNVGCGGFRARARGLHLGRALDGLSQTFGPFRALLARGRWVEAPKGAPLRCRLAAAPLVRPGPVIVTGEAAGSTLPYLGEGIGKALETGKAAGRAAVAFLADGDPAHLSAYENDLRRTLGDRQRAYAAAQRWLAHPWVCDRLAQRTARNPALADRLAQVLREETSPRSVFSPRGLLSCLLPLRCPRPGSSAPPISTPERRWGSGPGS